MSSRPAARPAGRVLRLLLPTQLQRAMHRRQLRRRHGLAALGPDFDYFIADNVTFGKHCRLGGPCYLSGSTVGDFTYIEVGSRISGTTMGKFCSVAPYALVGLAEHPSRRFVSSHPIFYRHLPDFGYDLVDEGAHDEMMPTHIGNDVWIGAGACVKSGVTIGDGAIVGAGAVVASDVPPYAIVGGVPARLIRSRFTDEEIAFLLELRWWDRDLRWIRANARLLQDISALMSATRS